jgi:hypothetical protein
VKEARSWREQVVAPPRQRASTAPLRQRVSAALPRQRAFVTRHPFRRPQPRRSRCFFDVLCSHDYVPRYGSRKQRHHEMLHDVFTLYYVPSSGDSISIMAPQGSRHGSTLRLAPLPSRTRSWGCSCCASSTAAWRTSVINVDLYAFILVVQGLSPIGRTCEHGP